jgi:PPM family protein phosphatase
VLYLKLNSYALTDRGLERIENQDAWLSDETLGYFVVADGMGGMENGKDAAEFTVKTVSATINGLIPLNDKEPGELLCEAITKTGAGFIKHLGVNSGSTVVAALCTANLVTVANLGDSPAYLSRKKCLYTLTKEHNLANLLVEVGRLKPGKARTHHTRHQLIAYVGMTGHLPIHIHKYEPQDKDRLLICTDGLTGMVTKLAMKNELESGKTPKETAHTLVKLANEAGGADNTTVIIVDFEND